MDPHRRDTVLFHYCYAILESRFLWAILFFGTFAVIAVRLGPDATPDFRIYHYYNGFAALVDRSALDIVPAQLQTFYFPYLDAVYFWLFQRLNSYPTLLNVVLSIPYGVAALLVLLIGEIVLPAEWPWRRATAGIAALFGLTGAACLPTLATTMSEVVPGLFAIGALLVWLRYQSSGKRAPLGAGLAGALAGVSLALKLTMGAAFAALLIAILFTASGNGRERFVAAVFYVALGLLVFVIIDGPWLMGNYLGYGNPILPHYNDIFRSDFVDHGRWTYDNYKPKNLLQALFYPVWWAFALSRYTSVLNMQDPRILLGLVCAASILATAAVRRLIDAPQGKSTWRTAQLCLAIFFFVGYYLWEYMFSVYRYLAIFEALTGLVFISALCQLGLVARPKWALGTFLLVAVTAASVTSYPWWSRAAPAPRAFVVELPKIEADSMVILLDPYAYSYLVPWLPRTVRVVGANNNMIRPGSRGRLQVQVESAINNHPGPMWGMEDPLDFPGAAEPILAYYRLQRTSECTFVQTNIEDRAEYIRVCRLMRR